MPDQAEQLARLKAALAHRYVIERELGHGGMSTVYLAQDRKHHRPVAIKVLNPELAAALGPERFAREIDLAAKLNHPHILSVFDSGQVKGFFYYVMPLVEGESLRERLDRERQLPVVEAVAIAREVADALDHAHRHGVVHRDIKPDNILLTEQHAVVADFGVARAIDAAGGSTLTATGVAVGTPSYMSPEQASGVGRPDGRSDIYSLGCVIYEMLGGQPPFTGPSPQAVMARHTLDPVPRLRTLRESVPGGLEGAIEKALAKASADRFATAAEFAEALQHGLTAIVSHAPSASRYRWRAVVLATAVVAALALSSWLVTWLGSRGNGADIRSLAVLPLENLSRDPDQDYFAAGMTEELITTLTKIEGLRVIAHRSVLQFRHSEQPVPEIARLLDVKYVVDGSVLQDENRVRITVSLIDGATNTPVWRDRFERDQRGVLQLQREVALAIAREIEVALTPQDRARLAEAPQVDPEAFDLYVRGTQARYESTSEGYAAAADYFTRALAMDSTYAPAYAGLASAYAFLGDKARAARYAEKALALDPTLAEPDVVLGLIRQVYDLDWAGAEQAFRQAIQLNPGDAEAHHELSMLLMRRKRFDEALREGQLALYMAPMSARFQHGLGEVFVFSGRYEDALDAAAKALALDPGFAPGYWVQGIAYGQQGRYEEAVVALTRAIDLAPQPEILAFLGYYYGVSGKRREAIQVLDTLKAQWVRRSEEPLASDFVAAAYVGLGDREQALEWLERAVEKAASKRSWAPIYLGINPAFRPLHSEPRFQALLKRIGLEE